ncbi:HD-GYP domain-containing protein [Roseateles puraquae]|uniref:Metal-dependent phosphohydrolase n=1 Tax=Roseateles puraquae TaxID=431059 RepID=A0A254NBC3_9BURK|nr:HD domain-containing phosphohydrolase [Roseateles puraquae]MDG0856939.1 HD domain-containing protein [Roseateles puraquae]OWR02463.1 metal-dependent phosphohydrolase [Roseateles puraquae]
MRTSEQVLNQAEIERSGLGARIQSLHAILSARYPFIGRIALAVYDPGTDLLKTFVSSNDGGPALQRYEAALAQVPSLASLRDTRSPRVVDDIDDRYPAASTHTDWLKAHHFRSSYTLPIFRGADLSAFLFFDSTTRAAFTPTVRAVLDQFADIITQLYLLRLSAVQHLIGAVDIATGLARIRDVETGRHLERMAKYSRLIARGVAERYGLSDEAVEYLHLFAPLHDIGKVGIPDAILLKPGKLDADEWALMQQHVRIGEQLIDHIIGDLGLQGDEAATLMRDVVAGHHERGDGSGYPRGLRMADIPVAARIVAVADMYDALSSARPYKAPWDEARCAEELRAQVGRGLTDAACVEALLGNDAARREIRERYAD